jgi:capsular polysaccharide biosynthesis protein
VTSDTPFQQLLRALVRFWWVAIVGVVLAGLAFVFATYKVSLGLPPTLTARAQSTYTASTQLLITSKREPYLSANNVNNKVITYPASTDTTTTTGSTGTATPTQTYGYDNSGADGDLQRMVEIANSLPPRVTSDPVIRLRNRDFRRIDGSVTAVNPYAFSGAGGFRSGPLPYIKVTGTSNSPQDALDITNTTALAFKKWFEARQVTSHIKISDRVLVEQVNSAEKAFAQGGSKPLLGVLAALLVLLGAAGFALALERLIPRRSSRAHRPVVAPAPLEDPVAASEPQLPALEVPTMTFATQVADGALGEKKKPNPRPRKQGANGNGAAPRRRRTPPGTGTTRVAPTSDDAS